MNILHQLFTAEPLLALFMTIALGYLVGKIKIGSFVLGGIAGTLLVGVVIGQLGIDIDSGIKNIFFALFIYAVGFQGGPQFFHALNMRSLNQLASAFVMCFVGSALRPGGGLDVRAGSRHGGGPCRRRPHPVGNPRHGRRCYRQVGAIARTAIKTMQTNVAVGYAVCYIFGSLGPIIMVSWFLPHDHEMEHPQGSREARQPACPAATPSSSRANSMRRRT